VSSRCSNAGVGARAVVAAAGGLTGARVGEAVWVAGLALARVTVALGDDVCVGVRVGVPVGVRVGLGVKVAYRVRVGYGVKVGLGTTMVVGVWSGVVGNSVAVSSGVTVSVSGVLHAVSRMAMKNTHAGIVYCFIFPSSLVGVCKPH
jgi:hypothetical protein